jgi:hypothetical protein
MENIQHDIHYLPYEALTNLSYLEAIYADAECNYYWSDDFSAGYCSVAPATGLTIGPCVFILFFLEMYHLTKINNIKTN